MPELTVLMTVFNGMPYLPLAMESILDQSYRDFVFLIVNDCSTDDSRDVILSYRDSRIRLIDNDINLKQTRSLNKGLANTTTPLVARMDADDLSHRDRLAKQTEFLQANPDVAVVGTNLNWIDEEGTVTGELIRPCGDTALRWMMFFECPISNGAAMFRTSVIWDALRGYDESVDYAQDWELWTRVPPIAMIHNLADKLVSVRQHSRQFGLNPKAKMETRNITQSLPARLLSYTDISPEWQRSLGNLPRWSGFDRFGDPVALLNTIEILFGQFCVRYPSARNDPEVDQYLVICYLRVFNSCRLRHLPLAFRCTLLLAGYLSRTELLMRVLKWPIHSLRLGVVKDWLLSVPYIGPISRAVRQHLSTLSRRANG